MVEDVLRKRPPRTVLQSAGTKYLFATDGRILREKKIPRQSGFAAMQQLIICTYYMLLSGHPRPYTTIGYGHRTPCSDNTI